MRVLCIDADQDTNGNAVEGGRWLKEGATYEAKPVIAYDEHGNFVPAYTLEGFSPRDGFAREKFIPLTSNDQSQAERASVVQALEAN